MEVTFIYPNQLFDPHPAVTRNRSIFLIEDPLFFGDKKYFFNYNKKKILLHYISMSYFARRLNKKGYKVRKIQHTELLGSDYTVTSIKDHEISKIHIAEVVDYELNIRIKDASKRIQLLELGRYFTNLKIIGFSNYLFKKKVSSRALHTPTLLYEIVVQEYFDPKIDCFHNDFKWTKSLPKKLINNISNIDENSKFLKNKLKL